MRYGRLLRASLEQCTCNTGTPCMQLRQHLAAAQMCDSYLTKERERKVWKELNICQRMPHQLQSW